MENEWIIIIIIIILTHPNVKISLLKISLNVKTFFFNVSAFSTSNICFT